jgi:hypothetical protein
MGPGAGVVLVGRGGVSGVELVTDPDLVGPVYRGSPSYAGRVGSCRCADDCDVGALVGEHLGDPAGAAGRGHGPREGVRRPESSGCAGCDTRSPRGCATETPSGGQKEREQHKPGQGPTNQRTPPAAASTCHDTHTVVASTWSPQRRQREQSLITLHRAGAGHGPCPLPVPGPPLILVCSIGVV